MDFTVFRCVRPVVFMSVLGCLVAPAVALGWEGTSAGAKAGAPDASVEANDAKSPAGGAAQTAAGKSGPASAASTVPDGRLPNKPSQAPPPAPSAGAQRSSGVPNPLPENPMAPITAGKPSDGQPSVPVAGKEAVREKSPGAAPERLKPIPDALSAGPVSVEAASFKGVTPGVTTLEEVQKAWGAPRETTKKDDQVMHLYRVAPFERVEASFLQGRVISIIIRLDRSYPASGVAQQLELSSIRPVLVSNTLGEVLGQSFPERGVLFAFEPSTGSGKPSMKVSQIILEPITAEPFVLRAETNLEGQAELCLRDLDQAIKLSPATARAHWLRARVLMANDDLTKALASADDAIRLEADNPRFRVTRAQILGQAGRFAEAMLEAERAVGQSEKRPHVKARALCLLGDLAGSGSQPDYKRALSYHSEAIKVADPLAASPHPAVRLPAKEALIDAHLGSAHDIAWGSWNQKELAVERWLRRAAEFADDLVKNDGGTAEHRFRIATRALAAYVGVQGKLDPTEWTEDVLRIGQELIAAATDPVQKQQIQWDMGMALYDTVQLYQMRKEYEKALKYGERAVAFLDQGTARRPDNATDNYFLGRLYFRLGAIHAIGDKKDHHAAVTWFDKAIPVLDKSISRVELTEKGRLGETLVSMGVSFWEVGQRDKAMDLTSRGVTLMEAAARDGTIDKASLEVPYSNIGTMYRQLGKPSEAEKYLEKANKNPSTLRR